MNGEMRFGKTRHWKCRANQTKCLQHWFRGTGLSYRNGAHHHQPWKGFARSARHFKCRVLFARNPAKSAKIGHSLLTGIS
jgi:hypothetical protein